MLQVTHEFVRIATIGAVDDKLSSNMYSVLTYLQGSNVLETVFQNSPRDVRLTRQ